MDLRLQILDFATAILSREKDVDAAFRRRTATPWKMETIGANGEKDPEEILNRVLFHQKYCESFGKQTGMYAPTCLRKEDLRDAKIKKRLALFQQHLRDINSRLDQKFPRNAEKNPARQRALAIAIFVFVKTKNEVDFSDSELLKAEGLAFYEQYLKQNGGLGLDEIEEDLPREGSVSEVLTQGKAGPTEKAYLLDYFLRAAGLNAGFAEASLSPENEPNTLLNRVILSEGGVLRLDVIRGSVDQEYKQYMPIDDYQAYSVYALTLLSDLMPHDPTSPKIKEIIDRALAGDPLNPEILAFQALFFAHQQEWKRGEASLQKALNTGPENIRVLDQAAQFAALYQIQREEADDPITPESRGKMHRKIYDRLSPIIDAYAQEEDKKRYFPIFAAAAGYLKKLKDAQAYYDKSFGLYRENPPIMLIDSYGTFLGEQRGGNEAVQFYASWIAKMPHPVPRILSLHYVHSFPYERGEEKKNRAYQTMLAQDPNHWPLWVSYGDFLKERKDNYSEALAAYERAKKIQINAGLIWKTVSLHEHYKEHIKAGRTAQEGLSRYPDKHHFYYSYAKNMYLGGAYEEMIDLTKKGHDLFQERDELFCHYFLHGLVQAAQSAQKQSRAQWLYEQALEEGRRHDVKNGVEEKQNRRALEVSHNNLACIHLDKKELPRAKELLEEGVKLNPRETHLLWNYSVYLSKVGKREEAEEYKKRVEAIDAKFYQYLLENNVSIIEHGSSEVGLDGEDPL